jgi:hypothetical protein
LFRARPPAQRPKAFAAAAGKNECVHRIRHVDSGDRVAKIAVSFSQTRRIW